MKPGTVFEGNVNIVISEPVLEMQGIKFGDAREIGDIVIDKWLEYWEKENKAKILIENILIHAIQNIKVLGGQKSKGAGKVNVTIKI